MNTVGEIEHVAVLAPARRHWPARFHWALLAGVILVQAAWILAMPAFRGPDEFDHVYRADAVAHGHLAPGPDAMDGRGQLTPVRESIVQAASKMCAGYKYTGPENCHPVRDLGGGTVTVASGAGRYNPAFYAVAGTLARPFGGTAVDYAIRIATGLMCAGLLAWAAIIWSRRRRSLWPAFGLLAALSPVFLYSTAIAAPNGVSYASAVLVWVAGIDITRTMPARPRRSSLVALAVGSVTLCNTHTTGPMWLAVIAVAVMMLAPARHWWAVVRDHTAAAVVAVIGAGGVFAVAWTLLSGANTAGQPDVEGAVLHIGNLIGNEILWPLQSIAAFPLRNEAAPSVVYALWLAPFVALMVLAVRLGGPALRATGFVACGAVAIPTVLTLISFSTSGFAWQGRYALPMTVGLLLLPASLGDGHKRLDPRWYAVGVVAMALAMGISVWNVASDESGAVTPPVSAHIGGGAVVVGLIALAGTLLMAWALAGQSRTASVEGDPAPSR